MPNYKFSSAQILLPATLSNAVYSWGRIHVPREALYVEAGENYGRQSLDDIHVTVLYGMHTEGAVKIRRLLSELSPFRVTLGTVQCFRAEKYDVLHIRVVESPGLREVNRMLRDEMANTVSFDRYTPHVTIAYVKKGSCDSLVGSRFVYGRSFLAKEIEFSGKGGWREQIRLVGPLQKAAGCEALVSAVYLQKDAGFLEDMAVRAGNWVLSHDWGKRAAGRMLEALPEDVVQEQMKKHITPERVVKFVQTPEGRTFLKNNWRPLANSFLTQARSWVTRHPVLTTAGVALPALFALMSRSGNSESPAENAGSRQYSNPAAGNVFSRFL